MKPNFALSLSLQGIALLHRAAGGWRRVGQVALEADDLAGKLAALRTRALALEPEGLRCKLVIPDDQIRYLSIDTGAVSGDDRRAAAAAALKGATPYAIDELAFDISIDGARTHVAAVARETLAEAEAFAVEHRFNPVSFVAAPGEAPFLGEPFFGPSRHAASLPGGAQVEPDGIAVVVIGDVLPQVDPAEAAPPKAKGKPAPAPMADGAEASAPTTAKRADPAPPVAGFSSRRGKPATPELGGASRNPASPPPGPTPPGPKTAGEPAVAMSGPKPAARAKPAVAPPPPPKVGVVPRPVRPAGPKPGLAARLGGLLGRSKAVKPAPAAKPAAAKPPPQDSRAVLTAAPVSPRIDDLPPDDESARLTLFGARKPASERGRPRHLGLILTAALLLFLVAVAAWASVFLDDGIAGLFRRGGEPETRIAVTPEPENAATPGPAPAPAVQPAPPETAAPVGDPGPALPQLAMLPDPVAVPLSRDAPEPPQPDTALRGDDPAAPALSDTDTAVLDALREPAPEVEREAVYAATGIWDQAPEVPDTPSIIGLDDIYVASIDRTDLSQDAVALPPAAAMATDLPPDAIGTPPAAETRFDIDDSGLVVATVDGSLSPEGVMVYLGRPARVPPPPPARPEPEDETAVLRDRLAGFRPKPRPDDLVERTERGQLGGRSREELAGLRPRPRPAGLSAPQPAPPPEPEAPAAAPATAEAEAVAVGQRPKTRPDELRSAALPAPAGRDAAAAQSVARSDPEDDGEPEVAAAAAPALPSSTSVARQATVKNAIRLNQVNLIGVYGTAANRRALIRLPSGRYKKVKVGDTVDGGKVVAIGDSELRYQKSGRNLTLKMPKG